MSRVDGGGKRLFPNPFYVLLLLASMAFVVTTLAYLVAPSPQAGGQANPLVRWLERDGPTALGVEVAVMIVAGLLCMATDRWFPEKPARVPRDPPSRSPS